MVRAQILVGGLSTDKTMTTTHRINLLIMMLRKILRI